MRRFTAVWSVAATLMTTGCQTMNTGIIKDGPNSYTITRTTAGAFRVYGSVYRCQADRSSMTCTMIDEE